MDQISTFELQEWIEGNKTGTKHGLAGSAAPTLSIADLIALSNDAATTKKNLDKIMSMKLDYGEYEGTSAVRETLASLYQHANGTTLTKDNVILTNGASGANQLVLQALVARGDGVIGVHPTYAQLLEVPRAAGADMAYWKLNPEKDWQLSFQELEALVRPGKTKLIVINNPNNPTGSYVSNDLQQKILELAKKHGIVVFSDEVFRPLFHNSPEEEPRSMLDWGYDNVIVSGSLSKAYGMPGTRTGWVASPNKSLLAQCAKLRAYSIAFTTEMAEVIVNEALSNRCRNVILDRNRKFAREDIDILEEFVNKNKPRVHWVKPVASSTTLLQFRTRDGRKPVDDKAFCRMVHKSEGVLFPPASLCFGSLYGKHDDPDFQGFVRCQFLKRPEDLRKALDAVQRFLDSEEYDKVPAATSHTNGSVVNGHA